MKYFQIIFAGDYKCLLISQDTFEIPEDNLSSGIDLSNTPLKEKTVVYPVRAKITDWACFKPAVVSERLKALIESVNCGNIQFMPFTAERKDGKERHKLYVINYLDVKNDALDIENSAKYDNREIDLLYVIAAAVKGSKVDGLDIFRLPYTGGSVFVSEKLMKLIRQNKLTGMTFCNIKIQMKWTLQTVPSQLKKHQKQMQQL